METATEQLKEAKNQSALFGQWIGKFDGESSPILGTPNFVFPGSATFNIEFDRPNAGFACIDQGNQIHGGRKDFALKIVGDRFSGHATSTSAFDWKTNEIISVEKSVRRQKEQGIGDVFYLTELEIHDGYMGVTAATLFPGLDGVCGSLKERFFPPIF